MLHEAKFRNKQSRSLADEIYQVRILRKFIQSEEQTFPAWHSILRFPLYFKSNLRFRLQDVIFGVWNSI